jgi:hypothetical protein
MNKKYPYQHILKNLLHEQATEIIPLLLPKFQVKQSLDIEMPELKSTEIAHAPDELDQSVVGMVLPEAKVVGVYETEWIQHSGNFERVYRVQNAETNLPTYLLIEFQIEREDEDLPSRLLVNFSHVNLYVLDDVAERNTEANRQGESTSESRGYDIYPYVLCPFPQSIPAPVREEFMGKVIMSFNFLYIKLWEKDAREILNAHATSAYFLLPAMNNADANLLGLAIEELAQRFQSDDEALGRHLTGLSLMLQQSEMMPDEEKLLAQEHLKPFVHLLKTEPYKE